MTVCMRIFLIVNINVSSFDWPHAYLNFPWLIQFALNHGGGADFSCSIGSLPQDFHCFTWLQSSHWRLAGGTSARKTPSATSENKLLFLGKTHAIMYICFVHLVVLSYQVHYVNISLYTFHIDEYILYIYVQFSFFKVSRMFHPFPHCQDAYVDDASGTSDFRGPSSDGHSGLRGLDVIAKARQRIREVKERERHGMTCRLCRWQCSKVDLIHGIME